MCLVAAGLRAFVVITLVHVAYHPVNSCGQVLLKLDLALDAFCKISGAASLEPFGMHADKAPVNLVPFTSADNGEV